MLEDYLLSICVHSQLSTHIIYIIIIIVIKSYFVLIKHHDKLLGIFVTFNSKLTHSHPTIEKNACVCIPLLGEIPVVGVDKWVGVDQGVGVVEGVEQ